MQWYCDKKSMPLELENCHMLLALGNCYTVHSLSEQSQFMHFFSADLPKSPQGCLGPPLSLLGISVLPGCSMFSFSEKGPLQMVGFSPLFLWGTLCIQHHTLNAPQWSSWQSPSISIGQSHERPGHSSSRWYRYRVTLHKQNHFTSLCCQG